MGFISQGVFGAGEYQVEKLNLLSLKTLLSTHGTHNVKKKLNTIGLMPVEIVDYIKQEEKKENGHKLNENILFKNPYKILAFMLLTYRDPHTVLRTIITIIPMAITFSLTITINSLTFIIHPQESETLLKAGMLVTLGAGIGTYYLTHMIY